ncbi:hypothetical protein RHSIM_Rhsim03G0201900 [Rhododendron simsii]|uniref:RING-type E3 ubiquitin transferase n=1 Tax=Rhododendron simsii TaxID=118357 RepID=A0A834LSW5_RHOSS|nr:hypothetical protein RHSIM_Rhsim03G0201900 [Rhododendron simsii]
MLQTLSNDPLPFPPQGQPTTSLRLSRVRFLLLSSISLALQPPPPLSNLPFSVQVLVTDIDYKSQLIHVKDPNSCLPQQLQSLNLSTTPFQFADSVYNFSLFSCPSTRPVESFEGPWWSTRAACLSGDGHEVYVESSGMSIYYPTQLISCRKMYNGWSVPYEAFDQTADLQLTWPQRVCGKCEAERNVLWVCE